MIIGGKTFTFRDKRVVLSDRFGTATNYLQSKKVVSLKKEATNDVRTLD